MKNSPLNPDALNYEASKPAKSVFEKIWTFILYGFLIAIGLVFLSAVIGIVVIETNR